jgi:two-component system chemotaxis sensor kinase CheA
VPEAPERSDRQQARAKLVVKFRSVGLGRLERLNLAILHLERSPDSAEAAQEVLREIHTLKGEAKLVGLAEVSTAAHKTEDLILLAQAAGFRPGPEVQDLILAGLDVMAALLQSEADAQAPAADLARFHSRADRLLASAAPRPEKGGPAPKQPNQEQALQGLMRVRGAAPISVDLPRMDELTSLVGELVQDQSRRDRSLAALAGMALDWRRQLRSVLADQPAESQVRKALDPQRELQSGLEKALTDARAASFEEGLRIGDLESRLREIRMLPLSSLFGGYTRAVRDLARELHKEVRLEIRGENATVDKRILDQIAVPLLHLIRNAVDHGLEVPADREKAGKPREGILSLLASQHGTRLRITLADDGRGLDPEAILGVAIARRILTPAQALEIHPEQMRELLFRPGFSTKAQATELSGRGIGLDVVRSQMEAVGGTVSVSSEKGAGTRFELDVPISLVLTDVLLVEHGGVTWGLPASAVVATFDPAEVERRTAPGGDTIGWGDEVVPFGDLTSILGAGAGPPARSSPDGSRPATRGIILEHAKSRWACAVSAVVGHRAVVQREPDPFLEGLSLLSGTTILEDGRPVSILSIPELLARAKAAPGNAAVST